MRICSSSATASRRGPARNSRPPNRRVDPHAVAATQAAGIKEKHLKYERLDADNAILDDMRRWILGDLAAEARCAPEAKATTLKVHTGSIADHVSNWGDVRDTLRGTRYEKYLPQPIDPIIDPSNPRLPL